MNDTPATDEQEYRVLARKYRPKDFSDLMVGQEPMVRTLKNAFATGRIAQAWMLTGVRGVGKTTTARILARALNYQTSEIDQPTIDIAELGEHCQAIMDGRHVDVVEMDAASHTGIDDIREIIEQVRYRPVSARYKVYIIDEVHMLSTQAFNGLLKTLEEPPEHVKFIFATTEIRKVPITVLSRCQRFDLRRIDVTELSFLFKTIAEKEGVEIDDESLAMIARSAEGSARDGLSLLDQAIAHGSGKVEADAVRAMLGLSDRTRVADLFEHLMHGRVTEALDEFKSQYEAGANPLVVINDLADFTHLVTRMKYIPAAKDDHSLNQVERTRGSEFAEKLATSILSRTWQMCLKAIEEISGSNKPFASAEMALIRIAHSAHLPSPEDVAKSVLENKLNETAPQGNGSMDNPSNTANGQSASTGTGATQAVGSAPLPSSQHDNNAPHMMAVGDNQVQPSARPYLQAIDNPDPQVLPNAPATKPVATLNIVLNNLEDLTKLADQHRDVALKVQIRNHVRLVGLEPGRLEITLTDEATAQLPGELKKKLETWTGIPWIVALAREGGSATLAEQADAHKEALVLDARDDKDVAEILKKFPGARITDVRMIRTEEDLPSFSETEDGDIALDGPADDGSQYGGNSFDDDVPE